MMLFVILGTYMKIESRRQFTDTLLEDLTFIKLVLLGVIVVGVYLALLILYGIGAGSFYKKKHQKAKENVRSYYRGLVKLEKVSKRRKAEHE